MQKLLKDMDKSLCVRCQSNEAEIECADGWCLCETCLNDIVDNYYYEIRCAECEKLLAYEEESQRHPPSNPFLYPKQGMHKTEIFCSKTCARIHIVRCMTEDIENEIERENREE